MQIKEIAKICHEANRAYCQILGDSSQVAWGDAPEWQREGMLAGVEWRLANPEAPFQTGHEKWCERKLADGWAYGPVKDAEAKTHPCLVSYDELPDGQKIKDVIFMSIVSGLAPFVTEGYGEPQDEESTAAAA